MRVHPALLLAAMFSWVVGEAVAADYRTLRRLEAPTPVTMPPLAAGARPQPVRFSKVVFHPRDGEAWAVVYSSIPFREEGDNRPLYTLIPWEDGRLEARTPAFARAFDEELQRAGFKADGSDSLFARHDSAADLQVAVLVDDIKGRFCSDCPNLLNRKAPGAVVTMSARWEVYSTLQGRVVATLTTSGGGVVEGRHNGSSEPGVLAAFRENVRLLLASDAFRAVALGGAPTVAVAPSHSPIAYTPATPTPRRVSEAARSAVAIFAGASMGSGFLISAEGHVLTNQHVVGAVPYVKVRWPDNTETIGEVLRADARRDVAVIKVDARGRTPLAIRSDTPPSGESVFAIGTPLEREFQGTVTNGIVSAMRVFEGLPYIQSDVAVEQGNSGGPLIDDDGRVVGITQSSYAPEGISRDINFFIPIQDALRTLAMKPAR